MMLRSRLLVLGLLASFSSLALADDEPPPAPPVQKLMRYVVVKGDSCQGLAQRIYGDARRIDLLHQFNPELGPQPHYLKEGQVLFFPPPNLAPPLSGPDARLSMVHNKVDVSNPAPKRGQTNDPLSRGHKVSTDEGSGAEIQFRDETRLQLGEKTLVVIFGDSSRKASQRSTASDTQLMSGELRAHLGALAGGDPSVQTPGGEVTLGAGEAKIHVDEKKSTKLMVYSGQSSITSRNQTVKVQAGFGTRATVDGAPSAPRPLPAAPVWTSTPTPSFLTAGSRVSFSAEYGPGKGKGPAPVQWHVQVARDSTFNALVVNARVPVGTTKLEARRLGPGRYFARVSAVDDEFEGPFSPVTRVLVTTARLIRDDAKNSTTAQIVPPDVYCGLDGGSLAPVSAALRKTKKMPSRLRCGPSNDSKLASDLVLPAPYAAPFTLKPRLDHPNGDKREATLVLKLQDAGGQPLTGSSIDLSLNDGVLSGPLEEGDQDGEYQATIWWRDGVTSLQAKARLDGSNASLVADSIDLPGPTPPPVPAATEPAPAPPPAAPRPRACGCQTPGDAPAASATLAALALLAAPALRRARRRIRP